MSEQTLAEQRIGTLYGAIKHGDATHQLWLRCAIDAHFAGLPVPAVLPAPPDAREVDSLDVEIVMNQISPSPSTVAAFNRILSTPINPATHQPNPVEFDGIRTGDSQPSGNSGELGAGVSDATDPWIDDALNSAAATAEVMKESK